MFTCKALANRLLALSNRFYKTSVLSLALHNKTLSAVLEQPVEMHFQAILTVGVLFYKLVFTVKTSCTPLRIPIVMFFHANER